MRCSRLSSSRLQRLFLKRDDTLRAHIFFSFSCSSLPLPNDGSLLDLRPCLYHKPALTPARYDVLSHTHCPRGYGAPWCERGVSSFFRARRLENGGGGRGEQQRGRQIVLRSPPPLPPTLHTLSGGCQRCVLSAAAQAGVALQLSPTPLRPQVAVSEGCAAAPHTPLKVFRAEEVTL
jgi:hypothetical protein